MIKSIQLKNFQSHRDTTLWFSPGVNVIVGDPQNGKTAILRALNLLRTNRPSGFRYHSHFAKSLETEIEVGVQEGLILFSKSEAKGASYSISANCGASPGRLHSVPHQTFTKAGTGVPDKVLEVLNLQDLNIQDQLAPHFLIADSPADVAREINRITNVDLVDQWTSALNRKKHAAQVLIGQTSRRVGELAEKAKALEGIEDMGPVLIEAEGAQKAAEQKKWEWNSVRLLARELEEVEIALEVLEKALTAGSFLEKAEARLTEAGEKKHLATSLSELAEAEEQLALLSRSADSAYDLLDEIADKQEKSKGLKEQVAKLETFANAEDSIGWVEEEIEDVKNEYAALVSESGQCPFCLTELTDESMQHVLEHL